MKKDELQRHPLEPIWASDSRILILGSFPSVRSRETGFYYGHPQNRFWKVLSSLLECDLPQSTEEKRRLLLSSGIALWDVVGECRIEGSSDSSICGVVPNDLSRLLANADIQQIYTNGQTAQRLYRRFLQEVTGREAICLPSTSPANAQKGQEALIAEWRVILEPLLRQ